MRAPGRSRVVVVLATCAVALVSCAAAGARIVYTVEYSGSYAWHEKTADSAGGSTSDETFSWTYRGTGAVATRQQLTPVVKLHGIVGIQGVIDTRGGTTPSAHCVLSGDGDPRFPGSLATDDFGASPTLGVDLPQSYIKATGTEQNCNVMPGVGGLLCSTSSCATICPGSPIASSSGRNSAVDRAWSPGIGPVLLGETLGVSRRFDMPSGVQDLTATCFNGTVTETDHLDITSHLSVGLSWDGPTMFIRFEDGTPPELARPADLLTPTPAGPHPPKIGVPPKIPQPPTEEPGGQPLLGPVFVQCSDPRRACPTTITVGPAAGTAVLARRTFSVPRATGALLGLKLPGGAFTRGKRLRARVEVAVTAASRTYRARRRVTLVRP